jgi:hypothetical protein
VSNSLVVATSLTVAGFGVLWVLFIFFAYWTWRQLHNRLYQNHRLGHIIMRLQVRFFPLSPATQPSGL